jgi:hypothetical protein
MYFILEKTLANRISGGRLNTIRVNARNKERLQKKEIMPASL